MNVTYPDSVRRSADFSLLERTSAHLARLLGQSAHQVKVMWEQPVPEHPQYTLRIADWAGEASTTLSADELSRPLHRAARLSSLWSALQERGGAKRPRRDEVTIRGSHADIATLWTALSNLQGKGWGRDTEAASRLRKLEGGRTSPLCLTWMGDASRPKSALWLQGVDATTLTLANVVPLDQPPLTDMQYDALVTGLLTEVLHPACAGLAIQIERKRLPSGLERELSGESMQRLLEFVQASKECGGELCDVNRWHRFILQTHREGADFYPSLLGQWLAEQGRSPHECDELVSAFHLMRSMLATYDEERAEPCP